MGEFETIQNRESHKSNGGQGTPSESPWTRLLRELQASLAEPEEQQQWDDLTLANYLAGLCTEQERTQIEQACQRSIELRMVIDSARMGLGLDQPTFAEEKPTPRSLRTGPVGSESVAPGLVSGGPTSGPGGRFPTWTLFRWIAVAAALAGVGFLGWLLAWETSRKTIGSLENQIASAQTQFQQKLQEHANLLDKTQQQATQHLQALQTDLQKRDQEIAKLKDSLAAQTDQLNRLEKELDVAQRRVPPIAAGQSAPAPPSGPSSRHEMFRPTIESAPKGQPQPSSWDTAGGPYPPSFPGYPGVSSATSVRGAPVILMPMYRLVQETMEANKIITMRPVLETSYREVVLPPDGNDTLPTLPWEMLLAGLSDPNDLVCWASVAGVIVGKHVGPEERKKVLAALARLDPSGMATLAYTLQGAIPVLGLRPENALEVLQNSNQPEQLRWAALYYLMYRWPYRREGQAEKNQPPSSYVVVPSPPLTLDQQCFFRGLAEILRRHPGQAEESPLVRKMALYLCGEIRLPDEADSILQTASWPILHELRWALKNDPDLQNRRWAAFALAELTPAKEASARVSDFAEILHHWASKDETPNPLIFPAVCYGLIRLSQRLVSPSYSQPTEELKQQLQQQTKGIRQQFEQIRPILRQYLKSPEPNLHVWAGLALQEIEAFGGVGRPGGEIGPRNPSSSVSSPGNSTESPASWVPSPILPPPSSEPTPLRSGPESSPPPLPR